MPSGTSTRTSLRQRDPGAGDQPQRRDPRRHLDRQRQRRRGDVRGPDARQGRGRRHAPGVGRRPELRDDQCDHRDSRGGDPARGDDSSPRPASPPAAGSASSSRPRMASGTSPRTSRERDPGAGEQPHGATLGGTFAVNASAGVATFSGLTLNKAGAGDTLQASSGGLSSATTGAITVTAATATQLVVTTQPPAASPPAAVSAWSSRPRTDFGNVDPTFTGSVTLALADQPQRCDPRRHLGRQRQRRRGDVHGPDARQGWGRRHASGVRAPA